MPLGNVTLREFADAVVTQIQENTTVFDDVLIMDGDPDDIQALSKNMGRKKRVCRVSYDPVSAVGVDAGLGRNLTYVYRLIVTTMVSTLGSARTRLGDGVTEDVTTVVKAAMGALEGETLGLFNSGALQCGSARYMKSGDSLQAMQFQLTGSSREARS
jgi:hypothetical protein